MKHLLIFLISCSLCLAYSPENKSAMHLCDNSVVSEIRTQNVWQGAVGLTQKFCTAGFTCDTGVLKGSFTGVTDAGAGEITVASVAHGMIASDVVTLTGTTDYNSPYFVTSVTTDSFNVESTYTSSQSGYWNNPSTIKSNTDGHSRVYISATINPVSTADHYEFAIFKNLTAITGGLDKLDSGVQNDFSHVSATTIETTVPGDVFWGAGRNLDGTANLTVINATFVIEGGR